MHWGEGALAELFHGDVVDLPGVRQLFGKLQRSITSPHLARLWWQGLANGRQRHGRLCLLKGERLL